MNSAILPTGTEIAQYPLISSDQCTPTVTPVETTGDLLENLQELPPRSFAMLRTTCGLLGTYLDQPGDQIRFDVIDDKRKGFRKFLAERKYAENSIRSYVYQLSLLLKAARKFGWKPDDAAPEAWKPLLALAAEKKVMDIARHFSKTTKMPGEVTIEDVDRWGKSRVQDGIMFTTVAAKQNQFWRLLQHTGWTRLNPPRLMKQDKYGVPLNQLAPGLKCEVEAILKWKQAEYATNRPKRGKIRAVSANILHLTLSQLAGYVINICGVQPTSLTDLVQRKFVEGFVEWAINERGVKGRTIQPRLGTLASVMKNHPSYTSQDFSWFKPLLDGIPLENDSEVKRRKAEKAVPYELLETIPAKIRTARETYANKKKKNVKRVAKLGMEQLMMQWLLVLPWRQRNLRECRISGPAPNLFKGKVPPFSDVDKPAWVFKEEVRNPNAEFWQFRFSSKETKTHIAVNALLPRQLIEPLEQYLTEFRPHLLAGRNAETLFLNQAGKPMRADLVEKVIGHWTLRYAGVRTTPHLFRDAVAFKWLKEHPKYYLTLSKMLWHKND